MTGQYIATSTQIVHRIRKSSAFTCMPGIPRILIVAFCEPFDVELEDAFTRLTAQGARTGVHSVMVVDRTSAASLPALIKSNIPARVAFTLTSAGESRAIDGKAAEKLEPGEIIYEPNYRAPEKLKAIFTPEINVKDVVEVIKQN